MSYIVLARKWRPQRFADLVGQDVVVRTLTNMLRGGQLPHAFLLTGIRGVGKTTIARLMAMAVNCHAAQDGEPCGTCSACSTISQGKNLDVQEMDAASHTGVDDIRDILERVRYPAVSLAYKVYIIDEAHMLTKNAFNALLKTLEEPPENTLFILATTESEKLPVTVRSRCQRFDLRRLGQGEISAYLHEVLTQEKVQAEVSALQAIAQAADGSVRDALSLTERVLAYSRTNIDTHAVEVSLGLVGSQWSRVLAERVLTGGASDSLDVLRMAVGHGYAPKSLLQNLGEVFHQLACVQVEPRLLADEVNEAHKAWLEAWASCWDGKAIDVRYQVLLQGLRDLGLMDELRGAEMLVLRLCHLLTLSKPVKTTPELSHVSQLEAPSAPVKKQAMPARLSKVDFSHDEQSSDVETPPVDTHVATPATEVAEDQKQIYVAEISPDVVEHVVQARATEAVVHPVSDAEDELPLAAGNRSEDGTSVTSWKEALEQYAVLQPVFSALLEQIVVLEFGAQRVRLALTSYQQQVVPMPERSAFQSWLGREVHWQDVHPTEHADAESLADTKAREAKVYHKRLHQEATQDPHIQHLVQTLDCQLLGVRAPGTQDA